MIERLILSGLERRQIEETARAAFPRECCGLLEGVIVDGAAHVTAIHPTRNLAADSDRFEIDPSDQIRILKSLRDTERDVVGCYHSHPNGRAEPSARDREGAFGEGFVWVITALEECSPTHPPSPMSGGGAERSEAEEDVTSLQSNRSRRAFARPLRPPFIASHRPPPAALRATSPTYGNGSICATIRSFEMTESAVREIAIFTAA